MFSLNDIAIQFPHAEVERVPVRYNILYSAVLPFIILILSTTLLFPSQSPNRLHKTHVTLLGLLISLLLTSFLTDTFKNAIGRPRPDLLARCKPAKGTPATKLVTIDVCTEKDHHTLQDGWRSFPSGHSSFAFSGLGYLSLCVSPLPPFFLTGQLHTLRPRADFLRSLAALAPLVCAALIAVSRCEDYRHDVYDVTVGAALGFTVTYLSYRRYYPSLKTRRCDAPYASRAESAKKQRGLAVDEEEGRGVVVGRDRDDVRNEEGEEEEEEEDENEHVPLRAASAERRGRRRSYPD
ncbi:MAG: hypothetical protein LQ344_000132 [Seirophora lacunosa]|nr:MAG: hypothetical protein LQ344_000132 [Seirophora lacunosa]